MSVMDKVNKIRSDIAALPAEYRGIFAEEQSWAAKHPYLYAGILLTSGAGLLKVALWVL